MSLGLILVIILVIFLLGGFQRALRRLWIRLRSWRRWSHRHDSDHHSHFDAARADLNHARHPMSAIGP